MVLWYYLPKFVIFLLSVHQYLIFSGLFKTEVQTFKSSMNRSRFCVSDWSKILRISRNLLNENITYFGKI